MSKETLEYVVAKAKELIAAPSCSAEAKEASHIIEGLWLHLSALQKQYKKYIKVIISEV